VIVAGAIGIEIAVEFLGSVSIPIPISSGQKNAALQKRDSSAKISPSQGF
jgi:hypothetical protein